MKEVERHRDGSITYDEQGAVKIREVKMVLEELCEFFRRTGQAEMVELYGDRMGKHLWEKLIDHKRNFGTWMCCLDPHNLNLLAMLLTSYVQDRQGKE